MLDQFSWGVESPIKFSITYFGGSLKNAIFRGGWVGGWGGHGKPIYRGNYLDKGRSSTVCRFKDKETCNKRGGSAFETGEGG